MEYTLEEGLKLVRWMESKYSMSCACHFTLGGSVLHKGKSEKDYDIFAYPHEGQSINKHRLIGKLESVFGKIKDFTEDSGEEYDVDKPLIILEYRGKRIDLFLMSAYPF